MPKAIFVQPDQTEHVIDIVRGESPMRAAVREGIDGILGECGGGLTCSTCHVYVDPRWAERLPPPQPDELEMLDYTAAQKRPGSRLSCQIRMTDELDGIRFELPDCQI